MRLASLRKALVRCLAVFPVWSEMRFTSVICDSGILIAVLPLTISVPIRLRLQAPVSEWMAGTRFSTAWTYAYAAYLVLRLSNDLAYIIIGYYWSIITFFIDLIIVRFVMRFLRILNSLTPAEIEQLRNPSAVWSAHYRRQPFQML